MKLKILLVPVSVVVSLVLIIGYIYPTWFSEVEDSIKKIKGEIKKETIELNTLRTKKSNAEKLAQSLQENIDSEVLVNKYYPNYRNDEDVVNNINNIAFSEGIFLKDMKVEYKKVESSDDPVKLMSLPLQIDNSAQPVVEGVDSTVPMLDENGNSLVDLAKARIKFIEVALKINGNYDQIKRFAISLNRVGLLNNIQSFEIYKDEKIGTAEGNKEAQETTSADSLVADIVVGFGYLTYSSKDVSSLLSSKVFDLNKFDFEEVNNLRSDLTGSYKPSEIGETGNQNPFVGNTAAIQQ